MADYPSLRPVGYYFKVEFPDLPGAGEQDVYFQDVAGLNMELETESVKAGGENRFTQVLPTRTRYPNLSLKRSLLLNSALINWCKDSIQNFSKSPEIEPHSLIVKLLNDKGEPLLTYNFVNAYPIKWAISDLNAQESRLVIESLDFYYQYFRII